MKALLLLSTFILLLLGFKLDAIADLSQPDLFWSFTLASAIGTLGAIALRWDSNRPWWRHITHFSAALVLWRLSYFPHLVFAGFLATLGEVALHTLGFQQPPIYPFFLLALASLHLGSLWAFGMVLEEGQGKLAGLQRLLRPPQALVAALSLPALMIATMVSLSTPQDQHFLPDRPWATARTLPTPGKDGPNPYMPKALESNRAPAPRILLLLSLIHI